MIKNLINICLAVISLFIYITFCTKKLKGDKIDLPTKNDLVPTYLPIHMIRETIAYQMLDH